MTINYDTKKDLLYIRFEDKEHEVINNRVSEDIVFDMGENDKIIGIEILNASRHLNLEAVIPPKFEEI